MYLVSDSIGTYLALNVGALMIFFLSTLKTPGIEMPTPKMISGSIALSLI